MSEMSEQLQLEQRVVNYKLGNFVGIFKNAYTKEFCEGVIKQYEDMAAAGHGQTRFYSEQSARTTKDDTQVFADDIGSIPLRKVTKKFNETQKYN